MTNHESSRVTVYAFMTLEGGVEGHAMAPFKATRHAIESRYGGRILEGTAQRVDPDDLDPQGRLLRVPTGWGELPLS